LHFLGHLDKANFCARARASTRMCPIIICVFWKRFLRALLTTSRAYTILIIAQTSALADVALKFCESNTRQSAFHKDNASASCWWRCNFIEIYKAKPHTRTHTHTHTHIIAPIIETYLLHKNHSVYIFMIFKNIA